MKKIDNNISKLIPYIEEEFITFPLIEEGNFSPQVNFWFILNEELSTSINLAKEIGIEKKLCIDYFPSELSNFDITIDDYKNILNKTLDVEKLKQNKKSNNSFLYHFSIWSIKENEIDISYLIEAAVLTLNYLKLNKEGKNSGKNV